jgi:SET family sugar efflux transporter-like MFS transporter
VPNLKRLLIPSAALLWGLQFAFLNPALALLLVALFDATAAEVGWVLAVYNASGFVASLVLPRTPTARVITCGPCWHAGC